MSIYLTVGVLIAGLLAYRPNFPELAIACLYWLITTLWVIGLIDPFTFSVTRWVQLLNINISYHIDGLSHLFTFLIAGIGIVVLIYGWFYTEKSSHKRRKLLSLLQLFAISMLGLVLANDMIMLFLCWELTSIISYLLIQFDVHDKEANQAAFNSLFVSVLGGLILLVGFIVLNHLSGSWDINNAITQLPSKDSGQLTLAFYLLLWGIITKSAQFPFYFWLVGAMRAPTPVSAYLHSATMVNAGIYLLARYHPLFSTLDVWYPLLSTIGLMTMAISSVLSLFQQDLKAILAYTTIFALGVMVYLLGGKNSLSIEAFTIFLLFHGIYKASAFMLVGIIDKEYHTRQLNELAGIARKKLPLALNTILIFGAMAGIPPFFGFTVKEMIYEAKLALPSVSYYLMGISIFSSMLIAAVSFRCLWFFFKPNESVVKTDIKKKYKCIFICPALLAVLIVLLSVFDHSIQLLIESAIQAIVPVNQLAYITPNTKVSFLLSLITSAGGVLLFTLSFAIKMPPWSWFKWLELKKLFESSFNGLLSFGHWLTALTQGQAFINQLRIFFIGIIVTLFISLTMPSNPLLLSIHYGGSPTRLLISGFLLLSSLSLLVSRQFLYNLISLSLMGFSASFYFIVYGAIDVAITQLLVEVLSIIILLIALRPIKQVLVKESQYDRLINGIIALAIGCMVVYILFALTATPFNHQLQTFYIKNSLLVAYGKNVVNVILVDFRSLDTFGEAIVIVTTAIGATLLLKKYRISKRKRYVNHR